MWELVKVKNFFKKVGLWFKNHAPTKRRLIQIYTALLYNANIKGFVVGDIYKGNTKYACVPGFNCYSCPGAIGACPLGSLQDSLAQSGQRAPFYILGILALFGLIFARTICGFLCPVGLGQELLYKIKTPKLRKSRYTRILSYFKYVLLVVFVLAIPLITSSSPGFCKYICPVGTFEGAGGLLSNPNQYDKFESLGFLFSWKFIVLVIVVLASIFVFRFFCRFICPLGAIYGFFNKYALIGVKLDDKKCVDCGRCIQHCKMDIKHVGDHECINCGECIPVCPTKAISWKGSKLVLAGIDTSVLEEKAPLKAMAVKGKTVEARVADDTEIVKTEIANTEPVNTELAATDIEEQEERIKEVKAKIKKRGFWLQFTAWAVALAVLVTALVYYNFVAKSDEVDNIYKVGDTFIDPEKDDVVLTKVYLTAGAYNEDGTVMESLSLQSLLGKVTVFNFWYTDCAPCVRELPEFEEVKKSYGDEINMIVVHSNNGLSEKMVQDFIDGDSGTGKTSSWSDWQLIFTHDNAEVNLYHTLGGKSGFPRTVIMDAQGVITYQWENILGKQVLIEQIESAMNK